MGMPLDCLPLDGGGISLLSLCHWLLVGEESPYCSHDSGKLDTTQVERIRNRGAYIWRRLENIRKSPSGLTYVSAMHLLSGCLETNVKNEGKKEI